MRERAPKDLEVASFVNAEEEGGNNKTFADNSRVDSPREKMAAYKKAMFPFKVSDKFDVLYLGMASDDSFWCQLLPNSTFPEIEENISVFAEMSNLLQQVWRGQRVVSCPCDGMAVMALYSNDGKWYRAVVTEVKIIRPL